jgi:hypothetical protein
MYGERIDPWMYVSKVSPGKGRHFHEFFVEDKYGDLVFRELDKYNLLLCHALRELNLDHTPELVHTHVLLTALNKLKYTTTTFYSAVGKYIEDRKMIMFVIDSYGIDTARLSPKEIEG